MSATLAQALPPRVLGYGVDEPFPDRTPLWAGPLSLIFESGGLRAIRLGRTEARPGVNSRA